jgi:hypothetical protein
MANAFDVFILINWREKNVKAYHKKNQMVPCSARCFWRVPDRNSKKIVNRALIEWKGFVGTNGKPLKCTEQNKMEVMREFDWFAGLIEDCRKALADEVADEQEDAEKN